MGNIKPSLLLCQAQIQVDTPIQYIRSCKQVAVEYYTYVICGGNVTNKI